MAEVQPKKQSGNKGRVRGVLEEEEEQREKLCGAAKGEK
jgi:hypothetical protein